MGATTRGVAFTVALLAGAVPTQVAAQPGLPPDDPDSWTLAGTAKVLCSALFVSGRDQAEARRNVSDYFLRAKLDSITEFHVDRQRRLVRLTLAGRLTREAKLYGDQGCVIHQPGRDSVHFRPVRVATRLGDAATTPWPMGDVLPATPLPAGIDTAKLRQGTDAAFANPAGLTAAFVVVHKGRIIAERYANGAHKDMQLESWSMGKSITGTLMGILVQQGVYTLDQFAPVPEWSKAANDPRARIRVRDLMQMSSGLRFSRGSPEDRPGYHDHDLIYTGAIDAFQFAATRELQFEPGTRGRYRNDNVMLLNLLIRDAVRARGEEYLTFPQRALFDRIGIRRQVLETDPYGNFLLSGYDYGTARNWARIGLLYLNDGVWNGERLLPAGWTKWVSTPAPGWADSSYGGMVWVNGRGTWPLPRDAFAFRGAGGQETYVVPSLDLVVVRMGHFPGSRVGGQDLQRALPLIAEAVRGSASGLPAGAVYPGVAWDSLTDLTAAGWSQPWLDSTRARLAVLPTTGFMAIVGGKVMMSYGDLTAVSYLASVRKSVLSMMMGNYVRRGAVDLSKTLAQLGLDDHGGLSEVEKQATVKDLLTARSGVYHEASNSGDDLASAPPRGSQKPGTYYLYSNWDFNALGGAFELMTGRDIYDALEGDIARPIGMQDFDRATHRKTGDSTRSRYLAYHMNFSTRDMARVGYVMLRRGKWNGTQIVPADWVDESTRAFTPVTEMNPPHRRAGPFGYGYLWWVWDGPHAAGPYHGAYTGLGAVGQHITVLPALDLVVVHKTRPGQRDAEGRPRSVSHDEYRSVLDALLRAHCGTRC